MVRSFSKVRSSRVVSRSKVQKAAPKPVLLPALKTWEVLHAGHVVAASETPNNPAAMRRALVVALGKLTEETKEDLFAVVVMRGKQPWYVAAVNVPRSVAERHVRELRKDRTGETCVVLPVSGYAHWVETDQHSQDYWRKGGPFQRSA